MLILKAIVLTHVAATLMMTGIMWFVQLAYYPNLEAIGGEAFTRYEREHVRRITKAAWTMLLIELLSGLALLFWPLHPEIRSLLAINFLLLLVIWYSTWFIQVPLHKQLEQGFDRQLIRRLVRSNWLRTVCYSLRLLVILAILYRWL